MSIHECVDCGSDHIPCECPRVRFCGFCHKEHDLALICAAKSEAITGMANKAMGNVTAELNMKWKPEQADDPVNHPSHYTDHPSGIECIQVTEHMNFCLGNAVKYIWRADLKHDAIEDLKKAQWYLEREIAKREAEQLPKSGNNLPNAGK